MGSQKTLIILGCFLCSLNSFVFAQEKLIFEDIRFLVNKYSYAEEIRLKKSGDSYEVLNKLTDLFYNDSVYSSWSIEELQEVAYFFLKKRSLSMLEYGVKPVYVGNMRLWPGRLVGYCVNIVSNTRGIHVLDFEKFATLYSDYVCVKDLLLFENKVLVGIELERKKRFIKIKCEE